MPYVTWNLDLSTPAQGWRHGDAQELIFSGFGASLSFNLLSVCNSFVSWHLLSLMIPNIPVQVHVSHPVEMHSYPRYFGEFWNGLHFHTPLCSRAAASAKFVERLDWEADPGLQCCFYTAPTDVECSRHLLLFPPASTAKGICV